MATITASATGGNWSATTAWTGGVVPTAADDAVLGATSGTITVTAGAVCRSLDANLYLNTLTHPAATTLTIGDGTAGASNIALRFGAGMTYTLGDSATSAITFGSTSTTQQTVDVGGKQHGNLTFGVSGTPNYAIVSALNCAAGATVTSTFGHLHLDGTSDNSGLSHVIGKFAAAASNVRSIYLGAATYTMNGTGTYWNMGTSNNITLVKGTSTIIHVDLGAASTGTVGFSAGGTKSYAAIRLLGGPEKSISTASGTVTTFDSYERSGAYNNEYGHLSAPFSAGGTVKVTGNFKAYGTAANHRCMIWTNNNAVVATLDLTGATLDLQNITVQDMAFIRGADLDLSAVTGGAGDAGGNTLAGGFNLTFTSPITTNWIGSGSGNWSNSANWSSGRVPLPQDPLVITTAFTGSPTITCDMCFSCGSLDVSGSTGGVSFTVGSTAQFNVCGSFKGRSGANFAGNFYWNARTTNVTFTFNGSTITGGQGLSSANGGLISFTDNGTIGTSLTQRSGLININSGVTLTAATYISSATTSTAKSGAQGPGTIVVNGTGTVFSAMASLGDYSRLGRLHISNTSASAKTFIGNGNSFGEITFAGGTGAINFTGSNTFARLPYVLSPAVATVTFAAGTTTTIVNPANEQTNNGTNVVSYKSATGGSAATITKANGRIQADYVSLQDLTATGGAVFSAGANSTNVSGNTGWTFTAAPQWIPQMF